MVRCEIVRNDPHLPQEVPQAYEDGPGLFLPLRAERQNHMLRPPAVKYRSRVLDRAQVEVLFNRGRSAVGPYPAHNLDAAEGIPETLNRRIERGPSTDQDGSEHVLKPGRCELLGALSGKNES